MNKIHKNIMIAKVSNETATAVRTIIISTTTITTLLGS